MKKKVYLQFYMYISYLKIKVDDNKLGYYNIANTCTLYYENISIGRILYDCDANRHVTSFQKRGQPPDFVLVIFGRFCHLFIFGFI